MTIMDGTRHILHGRWEQLKGAIRNKWGRLTEDDLSIINGDLEKLSGKIREYYGVSEQEVANQIYKFVKNLGNQGENLMDSIKNWIQDKGYDIEEYAQKAGEQMHKIKEEFHNYQECIASFMKNKPFQTLGIAALAGALLALCMRKK